MLVLWNLLFTLSLTGTLLAHRVPFPPAADSPAVVVGAPTWLAHVPLGLMLLLFPVLFVDLLLFLQHLQRTHVPVQGQRSPRRARPGWPGILLGSFALVVLIFVNIFTNVWGYIEPVSPLFRNTFWLAFFLLSAGISLLAWLVARGEPALARAGRSTTAPGRSCRAAVIFLVTLVFALPAARVQAAASGVTSLRAMTFNTQQSNDDFGEKSFEAQLALIRQVSPDILALQESDSARISLNNNDYVRYFAEKLGYYSYYGPTPVTGTFGTAILSKYPLQNTRSVFIYSDKDETGVAEAEIEVNGMRFTIYNVHPDSSDLAMLVFARTLVDRAGGQSLRDRPGRLQPAGLRGSLPADRPAPGQRLDQRLPHRDRRGWRGHVRREPHRPHLPLPPTCRRSNPIYILPPESATDHPVHWTDIVWGER